MTGRCRLGTSNDEDAVIGHVVVYMGASRMEQVEDRAPWKEASATWQVAFREMAGAVWQALTLPAVFGSGYLTRPREATLPRNYLRPLTIS